MGNSNWYVFYVQGRKEQTLCDRLNKKDNLVAFIPKMERIHKSNGVKEIVVKPMFPGYLFIKSHEDHVFIQHLYQECRQQISGIRKQLKFDEVGTSALTSEEMQFLEGILDEEYIMKMSNGMIYQNILHVQEGPLMGREKDIKFIDRHKCLAKLYVEVLGRNVHGGLEVVSKK